jgi:hypothetical protein
MRHLVCVRLYEGRAGRGARDIVTTGRMSRQPGEPIDKTPHIRHEYVGDGEGPGEPFAPLPGPVLGVEPGVEEPVQMPPCRRITFVTGNISIDQGRLAASTELSAANRHSKASQCLRGSVGISTSLRSPR